MDAQTLIAAVCRDAYEAHETNDPKRKVSLATLRKVAERALEAYQAAPFPGRAVLPWVSERVAVYMRAVAGDGRETLDKDLLPSGHPARPRSEHDAWAELLGAEERMQALQKSLLESVTRPGVRKTNDGDLVGMNQKLTHLYAQHFSGTDKAESLSGVTRVGVVKAAAVVHEELERRGLISPDDPFPREDARALYTEAFKVRSEPEVLVYEGTVDQHAEGVHLQLGPHVDLLIKHASGALSVEKLAERFHPAGSVVHPPFIEPLEASFEKPFALSKAHVPIGTIAYTVGAQTDEFSEFFVSGALCGTLVVGKDSVLLRKSLVPYVLTETAVKTGYLPPEGESALPPSLEWDVPPEMRYWKTACGHDARVVRDELVRAGLFTESSVQFVDAMPRCTYEKRFVVPGYDAAPSTFAEVVPAALPEAALFRAYAGVPLAEAIAKADALALTDKLEGAVALYFGDDEAQAAVRSLEENQAEIVRADKYLVSAPDAPETRAALKAFGRVFALPGAPGRALVASHAPTCEVHYLDDQTVPLTEGSPVGKATVSFVSKTVLDEEQYVLGVVLEPDVVDAQQDTYSEEEVRKTAHTFMAKYQNAGLQHQVLVNDHVRIVESWLSPTDCEIGGQSVRKGTWLMGMVIESDELWAAVKAGELTGFSIGGSAIRTPEA